MARKTSFLILILENYLFIYTNNNNIIRTSSHSSFF